MNKQTGFLLLVAGFLPMLFAAVFGQSVPTPGAPQTQPVYLKNATLHIGNGEVVNNGNLLFDEGKIVGINPESIPENAEIIDLTGKHVYPGMIALATQIGLQEIEAVRATNDADEVGSLNPNARAIIGYNTDSRVTPTLRSEGVLMAQIIPRGKLFRGTSSVVQLDAWNWEDAAYSLDDAVHLKWPTSDFRESPWMPPLKKQKEQAKKDREELEQAMADARAYWEASRAGILEATDLRWEAMLPIFEGQKKLFVHAQTARQIQEVLAFAVEEKIKVVIVGGQDSHLCVAQLKAQNVPVVLVKTQRLPQREDEDIDLPFRLPKILQDAGVDYCLTMRDFWNTRNLAFQAGTAAAFGLDKEQALAAVTLNSARILGIEKTCGSLEVGKDAILMVTGGDLLDYRTSNLEMAWIQGRKMNLGNKQKDLANKFKAKYE